MREIIVQQGHLVSVAVDHAHAHELQVMSDLLDQAEGIAELVHADLVRGLKKPEVGRRGMSGELVGCKNSIEPFQRKPRPSSRGTGVPTIGAFAPPLAVLPGRA